MLLDPLLCLDAAVKEAGVDLFAFSKCQETRFVQLGLFNYQGKSNLPTHPHEIGCTLLETSARDDPPSS